MSPPSSSPIRSSIRSYRIIRVLGTGTFGCVFLGADKSDRNVAIKCLFNLASQQLILTDEAKTMASYPPHPNVVFLIEKFYSDDQLHLVMNYVGKDNLLSYINQNGPFPSFLAKKVIRGILNGLHHLHRFGFVHRDIKCENILLTEQVSPVICDLGFATRWAPGITLSEFCGSIHYSSPEILLRKPYVGPEVDIWSFGVVVYAIVAGCLPWDGEREEILEYALKGDYWQFEFFSAQFLELLDHLLEPNFSQRWSIEQIKQCTWLSLADILPSTSQNSTNYPQRNNPLLNLCDSEQSTFSEASVASSKNTSQLAGSSRHSKRSLFSTKRSIPEEKLVLSTRFFDSSSLSSNSSQLFDSLGEKNESTPNQSDEPKTNEIFSPERLDRRMTVDASILKADCEEVMQTKDLVRTQDDSSERTLSCYSEAIEDSLACLAPESKKAEKKTRIQGLLNRIRPRKKSEEPPKYEGNFLLSPIKHKMLSRTQTS